MKRDWDLIRRMLIAVEELPQGASLTQFPDIELWVFGYHAKLIKDAGLVVADVDEWFANTYTAKLYELTWSGHEFLDSIRHKTVWEKAKLEASEKGVSLTFEVLKVLATSVIKHKLGIDLDG